MVLFKYTQTGGSSDSGSPHTQNLSGAELNSGVRSLAALSSAPTLVDGATYEIDFNGVDAAGNAATEVSVTGIFFDTTVPADFTVGSVITTGGTVTAGKWNSTNTGINVTVPLPNDATLIDGTLQIQASVASGSYENLGSAHTIGGSEPNTNVTSSFNAATFEALSSGISDGESILFKAILTDKAGNATTGTQSGTSIDFDQSVPAFSSVTPSAGSSVKVADVGYTLSEAIASGTVKYTQTGGSSDSGSPHTQNLSGAELNSGVRSLAALSSAPTLVDGATYEIDFNGVDAAGNAATEVSVTGIFFDTTVPADFTVGSVITTGGTVTAGKWNSTNTGINVTVPLPNDATLIDGTLQIQASVASGSYENLGSAHTIGGSEPNTNVTSSFNAATFEALSSGISDGESILFKAILTDKAGNATTGTQSGTSIDFDQSVPAFSSVTPSAGSSVKVADVGYTLSEAIASGTVKYTQTGGSSDSGSPHTQNLSGAELNSGVRSLAALSSAPTLVDGATYEIDFNGVDAAGNAATEVSVTGIFFDTTVPADFTVGSVITTGGTVTAGKWNSTNTGINVTVPLPNDATLIDGTLQIQASVASGSYENLGSAHTIGGSEPNTNVTSSFNAATFEALSSGISDGESILFKAILTDKAGNATTGTQSGTSIDFDQSVPAFSSVTPSAGSSVKVADVGYTLSEAIASGTVKYTQTGGSSDSGSPHTQNLSGAELNSGVRSLAALSSAPTLVDGATYEIDFNGVDAAGNAATEVSVTGIFFDTTVPADFTVGSVITTGGTVTAGKWNSTNTGINVTVPLPNDATLIDGTLQIQASVASGSYENLGSAHTIGGSEPNTNVTSSFNAATFEALSSGISDGESILFKAILTDKAGNATTGTQSGTSIDFDQSVPAFSSVTPSAGSSVKVADVGYTLSEAIASGTVKYTQTGGSSDSGSPHTQNLSGAELNSGVRSLAALSSAPTLVDGATYEIDFNGVDAAGNAATEVSVTGIFFDTTVPADFTVGSVITTGGTVTAGKWNSTNTGINVTVPLPNDATLIDGTLQIQASVASGSYENLGSAHTIGGSEPNTNVTSSFNAATFEALSSGISDGESILFKAILTDKAGNATTGTQSGTSIDFDQSVPAFSSVTPSAGSSVKVADVGYTLSEAIASGTVKYTQTGGSSDSGSPHTQNLSGAELNSGVRSLAALSSAPTLVDGATYEIDFNGVDAAGNAATEVSVTGIFFDTTVPADFTVGSVITTGGTVTAGKWNSTNTGINVTVPLPNDATLIDGTLQIQASVASGSYENLGSAHTIGGSEPNTNVTSSFNAATFEALSSGISDGESILFKAILTDKAGNATTGTQSGTSIDFDQSVPAFSSVTPSAGSSVKVADVGYTLSEAIASGTVKYTQTGGSSDSGSPHTQNLSGAELNSGVRSLAALSSAPTLVDGATYEIDFNGVDAAGNAATEVSVTGIFFDTTVPADFTVGSVITTGGTVTAGKWNSTNTGINVTVPLPNDATLIDGTLQIQASVASGSYENLGSAHTIGGSEPNTNVTSSFNAATFEALSSGISDGESILFKAILTDKAGNATTGTQSGTSIDFDQSVPAFSSVTPSAGSSVKVADVGYTLSEAIASGTVKYTQTGGSSDSGSPHTQNLSGAELNSGVRSLAALSSAPTLVDGATYEIDFNGVDAAGNAATEVSVTGIFFDTTVPADFTVGSVITTGGTVTAGKWNSTNTGINVTVPLPNDATLIDGTLQIQASVASGSYENLGSAHTIGGSEPNTNVTSSFNAATFEALSSGISDGESILFKAILTDKAGNATTGTQSGTSIDFDQSVPAFSSVTPSAGSSVKVADVGYTLSEAIASGTVKYTQTGGSSDSGSPHTQNLSGAELNSGVRSLAALSSAPTLVDGATYEIDFNGVDAAGNAATEVSVTGIFFDTTVPADFTVGSVITTGGTVTAGKWNSTNTGINVTVPLPNDATLIDGTLQIQASVASGSYENLGSAHTIGGSEPNTNVTSSFNAATFEALSSGISDGESILFKAILTDKAGNATTGTQSGTSIDFDQSVPAFSSVTPSAGSSVKVADVGYTLSEAIASGTVKYTQTGGSSDSGSPHTQNLSGAELNSGVRSLAALSSAPTLVDGATYEIDFNGVDAAGNAATEVSVTGIFFDTTVPADFTVGSVITTGGTVTAGKWNSTNTGINVTVPLPNDATLIDGTLQIQASVASGSYENLGSAHTIGGSEPNTNVTSSFNAATFEALSSGISDGESILFKAILTDKAGNATTGTQSGTSIDFDQSVPAFSSVTPSAGSSVKVADVGYTLSEAIASGTVKYTQTGGSSDSGSPHTQNLSGAELNSGVRSLAALSSAPTLVDGATYEIDFNGVDAAGKCCH